MKRFARIFLLIVVGFAAALYGLGLSYQSLITPRSSFGQFERIHGDGWVEDGATITLRHLAERGNRLLLTFNPWRPAGQPPAALRVSVCGTPAAEFLVADGSTHTIFLTGSCQPREVRFDVLNPFVPAIETDNRLLGAQLETARIVSRVGPPLLALPLVLKVWLAIVITSLLIVAAMQGRFAWWAGYGTVLYSFLLLSRAHYVQVEKVVPWWLLLSAVALGGIFLKAMGRRSKIQARASAAISGGGTRTRLWSVLAMVTVAAGAALRLYGLEFGLPFNFHPDEVPKVNALMRMRDYGDFHPRYFLHPSLLLYSTYLMNTIFHWLEIEATWRESAFLAGRTVSLIAGTLSIYLVYLIGKRLYSPRVGVWAAAFLAVFPLHVTCSRYLKEDALLVCFLLATALAVVKAVQEDRKGVLLFAGFLAGCAMSVKYTGLLAAGILAMAPWLRSGKLMPDWGYFRWTFVAGILMPVGFLIFTPYALLDHEHFIKDVMSEKRHALRGHTITIDAWSQYWMYHFWRSIIPGMTAAPAFMAFVGIGLLLARRRKEDLYLVALLLLFYLPAEWVRSKPAPQPERYILPCLPFLAIALAEFGSFLFRARLGAVAVGVLAIAFVAPTLRSGWYAAELTNDTRDRMAQWMFENIPPGSKVFFDWKRYAPSVHEDGPFQVTYIPRAKILPRLDIGVLKESGYDYLVLSSLFYERYFSQPQSDAAIRQRFREVFSRVPIVKEISPPHGAYGFHNPTLTLFSLQPQDFARLEQELEKKAQGELEQTGNEMRASFRWSVDRN